MKHTRGVSGVVSIATIAAIVSGVMTFASPIIKTTEVSKSRDSLVPRLNIPFIENRGQLDREVAFYAQTFAGTVFVTRQGTLVLARASGRARDGSSRPVSALVEQPLGRSVHPRGTEQSVTRVNLFQGKSGRPFADLPSYTEVSLESCWRGISLTYAAHDQSVERLFKVEPGAEVSDILMEVRGAHSLSLKQGALVADTDVGSVTLSRPVAYQEIGGVRRTVPVSYRLHGSRYGFTLGPHDPDVDVTIDPLIQNTFLSGDTLSSSNAVDTAVLAPNGDLYVAGTTSSTDFPGTSGGAVAANAGVTTVAFIARLSTDVKTVLQATYFGSTTSYPVYGKVSLAINRTSGEVYLGGSLDCGSGICPAPVLPSTSGGAQTSGDALPGFIAAFDPTLTQLYQATYLGGSSQNFVTGLAIAPSGNVYVAGYTDSKDFPAVSGGAQVTVGKTLSVFVSEITPDLKTLVQSTYLGDGLGAPSTFNFAVSLALGPYGNPYVSGVTTSPSFPGTLGGAQPTLAGTADEYVAELSADLKSVVQSTYLGTGSEIQEGGLTIDPAGDVYAAVVSSDASFPGTSGGAQSTRTISGQDCVISRLPSNLKQVEQSTYLGGTALVACDALALDGLGNLYVTGSATDSGQVGESLPALTGGFVPKLNSLSPGAGFISKFNPALTQVLMSTFLGDGGDRPALGVVHGAAGDVYIVGSSVSYVLGTAGVTSLEVAHPTYPATHGFISHLTDDLAADTVLMGMGGEVGLANGNLDFTFIVENKSVMQPATGIVLVFTLPANVHVVAESTHDLNCSQAGTVVTCIATDAIISAGTSRQFEIAFPLSQTTNNFNAQLGLQTDQTPMIGSTVGLTFTVTVTQVPASGGKGTETPLTIACLMLVLAWQRRLRYSRDWK